MWTYLLRHLLCHSSRGENLTDVELRPTWFREVFLLDEVLKESLKSFFDSHRSLFLCSTISVPCGVRHINVRPDSTLSHLWVCEVASLFLF